MAGTHNHSCREACGLPRDQQQAGLVTLGTQWSRDMHAHMNCHCQIHLTRSFAPAIAFLSLNTCPQY
jgi:hypothetical protein